MRRDVLGSIIFMCFSIVIFGLIFFWYETSHKKFGRKALKPGEEYVVGGKTYNLPNIPVTGAVYPLLEPVLMSIRQLFEKTTAFLKSKNLEHWVSGGTLLGFVRHGTFMPNDDDIDLHVHLKNREFLYGEDAGTAARGVGLELFLLRGSSPAYATKEGAAVRVRLAGTRFPTLDIFFVAEDNGKIKKIDSWKSTARNSSNSSSSNSNGVVEGGDAKMVSEPLETLVFSKVEIWNPSDLFPVSYEIIDELEVPMPANPLNVVNQQYGPKCMGNIVTRSRWISHAFAFEKLPFVWRTTGKAK